MLKMKRLLSIALLVGVIVSMGISSFASEQQYLQTTEMLETELNVTFDLEPSENIASLNDALTRSVENFSHYEAKSSSAIFDIRMPKVFTVSKKEARDYGDNHFKYEIDKLAELFNIAADIDDIGFQTVAKGYALQDSSFTGLAKFIDIYENYDYNEKMKELITNIETTKYTSSNQLFLDENFSILLSMMPIDTTQYPATKESGVTASLSSNRSLSGYSGTDARFYAETWAYKTNNTDYGYYADYNNHPDPNNNNMWSGGTGNNKRTWNDCANFVSQCLKAGGANYIKKGLWFPHQNSGNWYYSDSKPSHSWVGQIISNSTGLKE